MSGVANNNLFVGNEMARVGIQIPFDVYPTQVSEVRVVSPGGSRNNNIMKEELALKPKPNSTNYVSKSNSSTVNVRLNKFVRRLHEMLTLERENGVVEWRRGLLVLHSIDKFSKIVLPKYFNTHNFKTFRRQLNYYGFVHVRSFSVNGATTTALWVNQELADTGSDSISSVLKLKRVEPSEASKTPEGRRERKNEAACSVEVEGLVDKKALNPNKCVVEAATKPDAEVQVQVESSSSPPVPMVVHCHYQPPSPPPYRIEHVRYAAPVTPRYGDVLAPHHHPAPPAAATTHNPTTTTIPYFTHFEHNISTIDQAAGLLLSLSRANV